MSSFNRFLVALTALVLVALTVGTVPAHAESSSDSKIAWTVRTALSKYGSGRPKFTYTVKSGEQLTDGIDINNTGPEKITLKVYAADGFTTGAGGFDVLTPEKKSAGIGSWVKPAVKRVSIPAGKQVQIPFTMTIPDNATPGDHAGGIVTVLDQKDPSGSGTVIHRRVGLRIEARVSGAVRSTLAIENLKIDYAGKNPLGSGHATLSYTVHNTGNTVLGGLEKATIAGGLGIGSMNVKLARLPDLLPGESWEAKVTVDDVHAMLWVTARVTVTPVVTDAAGSTSTLEPVTASSRTVVSFWSFVILLGSLVALAALVWLVLILVRRWRRSSKDKVDAKVAAAVEEALQKETVG
ncbi:MAG: WxL protein peptidoglycan domain-containing protein [Marmoricola sp.]